MVGKLIFVSGLSGSGKTTLITHALECLPNIQYLKTYTTRPKRVTEANSIRRHFNVLFKPTGDLAEDTARFTQSLKSLL